MHFLGLEGPWRNIKVCESIATVGSCCRYLYKGKQTRVRFDVAVRFPRRFLTKCLIKGNDVLFVECSGLLCFLVLAPQFFWSHWKEHSTVHWICPPGLEWTQVDLNLEDLRSHCIFLNLFEHLDDRIVICTTYYCMCSYSYSTICMKSVEIPGAEQLRLNQLQFSL